MKKLTLVLAVVISCAASQAYADGQDSSSNSNNSSDNSNGGSLWETAKQTVQDASNIVNDTKDSYIQKAHDMMDSVSNSDSSSGANNSENSGSGR